MISVVINTSLLTLLLCASIRTTTTLGVDEKQALRAQEDLYGEGSENVPQRKIAKKPVVSSYVNNEETGDLRAAPSHNRPKYKGKKKHSKGGGKSNYAGHFGKGGKKGHKGYKGHHEHEKGEKGYHDKEEHDGHYQDKGGKKRNRHHDDGYDGKYHKYKKGGKEGKFKDTGKHAKGHNTKGGHSINRKDHYEKNYDFFDEFYDDGDTEADGKYLHDVKFSKGTSNKGGHRNGKHHQALYSKDKDFDKGHDYSEDKGHNEGEGHNDHHLHNTKYRKKNDRTVGKKWAYLPDRHHDAYSSGSDPQAKYINTVPATKKKNDEPSAVASYGFISQIGKPSKFDDQFYDTTNMQEVVEEEKADDDYDRKEPIVEEYVYRKLCKIDDVDKSKCRLIDNLNQTLETIKETPMHQRRRSVYIAETIK